MVMATTGDVSHSCACGQKPCSPCHCWDSSLAQEGRTKEPPRTTQLHDLARAGVSQLWPSSRAMLAQPSCPKLRAVTRGPPQDDRSILYSTMLYCTVLYYTILYYTILYYTILYYTILYYTILYYTILYYTILYYTILYYTILYYTILYYTILYYTILCCGVLMNSSSQN